MKGSDTAAVAALRWGILGTGFIAEQFAADLPFARSGLVQAVASRNHSRGAAFAARYGIPAVHGSYQALVDDPQVDCVYLALPNHLHLEWTERAARAGKHVLCEKPLAMNAREAATAIAAAVKHEVVLLEAFMYRMHPQITELVRLLDAGTIGEVRMLEASFGGNMRGGYDNYRMQHEAGGGALLDLGCYGVSLARLVAGVQTGQPFAEPAAVLGAARLGTRSGVDEWSAAILDFGGPLIATVVCGNQVDIDSRARIWGSEGSIELTEPWEAGKRDRPGALVLHAPGAAAGETRVIDADRPLYALEADAFAEAVWHGRAPALAMTTDDSLGNMRVLDEWRRSVGLRFAQDSALRAHL